MQTLKSLAEEGCTVVCSIHQPRSSIFAMFDDLLILSEGKLLYEGSADGSLEFFEAQVPHIPNLPMCIWKPPAIDWAPCQQPCWMRSPVPGVIPPAQ